MPFRRAIWTAVALTNAFSAAAKETLVFDGPSGPVTAAEIKAFKECMAEFQPAASNVGNAWVYGNSGQAIEAIGLVYQISGEVELLNRMIELADTALSERNDLAPAPVGQRMLWTGKISPVWPNKAPGLEDAGYSATENGDIVGHIAYCAVQILQTRALWARTVPGGDPHRYGATYLERAKTYVRQMDLTCQDFMIPNLVRASDRSRLYFPVTAEYKNLSGPVAKAGQAVPWNQQFMITNGFQRLAEAHAILGDAPDRVKAYDGYVRESVRWFLSEVTSQPDPKGGVLYNWNYSIAETRHVEDSNHTDIDLQGIYRVYGSGRYADVVHLADLRAFANDNVDVMSLGEGRWAGHVNGHSDTGHGSGTNYPRPNFLFVLEFRPDAFADYAKAEVAAGRATGDFNVNSRLLWLKDRFARTAARPAP